MNLALSEAGRRIIDAVIDAPVAWRSPGELAERLGWSLESTLDEVAALDEAGWLEAWELVDGPVVTLSVGATAHHGVRLVEVGRDETLRWVRMGDPDPPAHRASGVFRSEQAALLCLVADGRPDPEQTMIQAEEAARESAGAGGSHRAIAIEKYPRPTLFIGGGLSPWPGPGQTNGQTCPACRSARLPALAYCLWCDRWGFDIDLVAEPVHRKQPRRSATRPTPPQAEARRQEVERRRREQKRKERRKLQTMRLQPPSPPRTDRASWSKPVAGRAG